MNCFINQIVIFNREGKKRSVSLSPGLNVVTGNSKTGKSALIEIVDYCFCSKTSNIPRGVISEFGYLFSIVIEFPTKLIVISRKSYFEGGNTKVAVKVELDKKIASDIDFNYVNSIPTMRREDAQTFIERNLNLSVTNIATSEDVLDSAKRKAGLREMTSLFFQHQNLLANKHALFYRFDDQNKRKATIDSFPVFSGWVNDEYFSLKRELEANEKLLRHLELSQKKREQVIIQVENEMKGYFKSYYSLVGHPFDNNLTLSQLISLRNQLPNYSTKTLTSQEFLDRYNLLRKEQQEKSAEFAILGKQLKDLQETENYANDFQISLKIMQVKSALVDDANELYHCPTCGKENDDLTNEVLKIKTARENLSNELSQLSGYAISYQKEIDKIKKKRDFLKKEIEALSAQIGEIEKLNQRIANEKNVSEQVIYAKAQLDLRLDLFIKEKNTVVVSDDLNELRGEIEAIKQKLTVFSVNHFYKTAETFFCNNMNKIGDKLDFEDQLKPLDFRFDLKEFKFIHVAPNIGEITINEMGSGANWLTCHLSLFLSFLHYLATEKNSVVPSFLFLDQPSQVYFPSKFGEGENKDNDIKQVEKIYIAILDEVEEVNKKVGFRPQVIVTDHADNLDLGQYNFNDYVRKRWTPEADIALI